MAYKGYQFAYTNQADFFSKLQTALTNMGWVLHDSVSATVKVFKSNGENANQPYGYIWIDSNADAYLYTIPYLYWNATTHAGTTKPYYINNYHRIGNTWAAGYGFISGSKDLVILGNNNFASASCLFTKIFGHIPSKLNNSITTTTAQIDAGANVAIPVASTTGFVAGMYITIVGVNYEGRDTMQINSIDGATQITVASVARTYASGAFIGAPAMLFGMGMSHNTVGTGYCFYLVSDFGASSTTDGTSGQFISAQSFGYIGTSVDPDSFTLKRLLQPIQFHNAWVGGYSSSNILSTPAGLTNGDIIGCMDDLSSPLGGTATSGAASTLTDSGKSWGTNVYANKFVVISGGTGIGQIRKIASNTDTVLTVSTAWYTNPDATSTYKLVDAAYRVIPIVLVADQTVYKETDHTVA
jgi:hypothetical protein